VNQGLFGFSERAIQELPYVLLQEQQANTTTGGGFTSGAWQTRVLNTVVTDASGLAVLASNQVTLRPGRYRYRGTAPGATCNRHQSRLQDITDATTVGLGVPAYSPSTLTAQTISVVSGEFQIYVPTTFELQHRCETTRATDGFGLAMSFGNIEVFAQLEFWKA